MKLKQLLIGVLAIWMVSSCSVDNPVTPSDGQGSSYRNILAGLDWGTIN
jgi:hypothetical protein